MKYCPTFLVVSDALNFYARTISMSQRVIYIYIYIYIYYIYITEQETRAKHAPFTLCS